MTVRKHFIRAVVAFVLVLTLLLAPAVPVAADEVGSGWTQGITDWVSTWIASWYSLTNPSVDKDIRDGVGSTQEALRPQPRAIPTGEDSDPDSRFLPPTVVLHTEEEQTCEAHPNTDPNGQC